MINRGKLTSIQQLRLLSLIVVVGLILSVLGHSITLWLGFKASANLTTEINFFDPKNWIELAMVCVIEEVIFRGVLSLSVKATCVSIFVWLILLSSSLTKIIFKFDTHTIYYYHLLMGLYALLSLCGTYVIYRKYLPTIISTLRSNYNLLFWILCVAFALAHVDNYVNFSDNFSIYLVLVVPQFIMGGLLAVVRVRNGIAFSAIIHFFADAWFFLFGLESSIFAHPAVKLAIGIFLVLIFLIGLMQIKLCKDMVYVLMKPSIRILGNSGDKGWEGN